MPPKAAAMSASIGRTDLTGPTLSTGCECQVATSLGFNAPAAEWRLEGSTGMQGEGSGFIDGMMFGMQL